MTDTAQLPDATLEEMKRLKGWMPYRIVYAAVNPDTNEVHTGAVVDMRQPNKYARQGWAVFTLGGKQA